MFTEPPGSYDICSICDWEDDPVQLAHPSSRVGANHKSLYDWQQELLERLPLTSDRIEGTERDPDWRPLTLDEAQASTPPVDGRSYFDAVPDDHPPYYWHRSK